MIKIHRFLSIVVPLYLISTQAYFIIDKEKWFKEVNMEYNDFRSTASKHDWREMAGEKRLENSTELLARRFEYKKEKCSEAKQLINLNEKEKRMIFILCRGPSVTQEEEGTIGYLEAVITFIYEKTKICRHKGVCYNIEPDLDYLVRESRDPAELLWAWTAFRDAVGPPSLHPFIMANNLLNRGARKAGYHDIGEIWREELETPNLEYICEGLLAEMSVFYRMIHGYVRFKLSGYYGEENVPADGPIPVHLLGNMWGQSWENLFDIVHPEGFIDLDKRLGKIVQTPREMLKLAERYYLAVGLSPTNKNFWNYSKIGGKTQKEGCHGVAVDLYDGDYRICMYGQIKWEDFYVATHEMGHVQYFIHYKDQPGLFKDAANSAFQETIGDTIMMAMEVPNNLVRMGIIPNTSQDVMISLLLRQALKTIPKLSYGFALEKWRWDVFSGKLDISEYNKLWWEYREIYEGVKPPVERGPHHFDPIAKYHIANYVPYIRYYLSIFLQYQIFDVLCEGRSDLNNCDLYGNKEAGHKLRKLMEKGLSEPWNEVLSEFSNGQYTTYSSAPIFKYYRPLIEWLEKEIKLNNINLGW